MMSFPLTIPKKVLDDCLNKHFPRKKDKVILSLSNVCVVLEEYIFSLTDPFPRVYALTEVTDVTNPPEERRLYHAHVRPAQGSLDYTLYCVLTKDGLKITQDHDKFDKYCRRFDCTRGEEIFDEFIGFAREEESNNE